MAECELAVLCLINNDREHTQRFVEYFTAVRGCRLILFLDNPEHVAFVDEDRDNLTVVPCSQGYWESQLGRMPADMPEKQHTNIRRGAELARELNCKWCVSVDSDELIRNLDALVPRLDSLGGGYDLLRLLPAELLHTEESAFSQRPFSGYLFKYRWSERRLNRLLLRLAFQMAFQLAFRLMSMRKFTRRLFFGHFNGKTIFRLDIEIDTYKQHKQFSDNRELTELVLPPEYLILHHDAMNFDSWLFKWKRRISGSTRATAISDQRKLQTATIAEALSQDDQGRAARQLFRRWYVFDPGEINVMKKVGYVVDMSNPA